VGFEARTRGHPLPRVPIESADPDLEVSLRLDTHAPRAARYHVARVDRPSPDLRDAVVLLTSELVTRAAQQCRSGSEVVKLRVWMPSDVVRVELRARRELLCLPLDERRVPDYDVMLLGQVADRWAIDIAEHPACMWFEIDRQAIAAAPRPEPHLRSRARRGAGLLGARSR
jgi:hypothetical protein